MFYYERFRIVLIFSIRNEATQIIRKKIPDHSTVIQKIQITILSIDRVRDA